MAVVLHSYRHRFGLVAGDPAYADVERRLAARPVITVPTVAFFGGANGVMGSGVADLSRFTGFCDRRQVANVGHNVPQEAPASVRRRDPGAARSVKAGCVGVGLAPAAVRWLAQ